MMNLMKYHRWKLFGEIKMSRNMKKVTNHIFDILQERIDFNEYTVKEQEHYLTFEDKYDDDIFQFVTKSKILIEKVENFGDVTLINNGGKVYIVVPVFERYEEIAENIGMQVISDPVICIGSGVIGFSEESIPVKETVTSWQLIDGCFGLEPEEGKEVVEITYEQLRDFFYEFLILTPISGETELKYKEDIYRLCGQILINCIQGELYDSLNQLLFMKSSRGIATTIIDMLKSTMVSHGFLKLYHCLEYLFVVDKSLQIVDKYSISNEVAVKLVVDEKIKDREYLIGSELIKQYASKEFVSSFYKDILQKNDEEIELEKQVEKISEYIYRTRCGIAHFKYLQDNIPSNEMLQNVIVGFSKIITSIYEKLDNRIDTMCEEIRVCEKLNFR